MKKAMRRNITPEDLRAAERLQSIWARKRSELKLTQESAADRLGITQGGFNQYLHGKIALNARMVFLVSKLLEVHPSEIRDDFDFSPAGYFSEGIQSIIDELGNQPLRVQEEVREYLRWVINRETSLGRQQGENGNENKDKEKS